MLTARTLLLLATVMGFWTVQPNGFLELFPDYRKWTVSLEMSCRNRCGNVSKPDNISCSCDTRCHRYGDCCMDYLEECPPERINLASLKEISQSSFPYNLTEETQREILQLFSSKWTCLKTETGGTVDFPKLPAISSCTTKPEGLDFCSFPNTTLIDNVLPLYDPETQRVYRNVPCALCNVKSVQPPQYIPFSISVKCNHTLDEYEFENIVDMQIFNCCAVGFNAPKEMKQEAGERCSTLPVHTISECPSSSRHQVLDSLCRAIYSPVCVGTSSQIYKNRFCAKCNNLNPLYPAIDEAVLSTSMNPLCTPNRIHLATSLLKKMNTFRYTYQMLVDFRNDYSLKILSLRKETDENRKWNRTNASTNQTMLLKMELQVTSDSYVNNLLDHITLFTKSNSNATNSKFCPSSGLFSRGFYSDGKVEATSVIMEIEDFILRNDSAGIYSVNIHPAVPVLQNCEYEVIDIRDFPEETVGFDRKTDVWKTNLTLNYTWQRTKCNTSRMVVIEHRCIEHIPLENQCDLIQQSPINENALMMELEPIKLGKGKFYLQNNTLYVVKCQLSNETSEVNQTIALLGFILVSVSLVSMLLTLVTYILLPTLRTNPGIYAMHLLVAMICAHGIYELYVFRSVPLPVGGFCTALAFFRCFIWLVAFFWQSAIAGSIVRSLYSPWKSSNGKKEIWVCTAVSWGVPLALVTSAAMLNHFKVISVVYSREYACRIVSKSTLLALLVFPMSLSLLINTVCFFLSFRVIYKNNKAIRQLKALTVGRHQLLVCVKISLLVGIPWLFVVLANIVDLEYIWVIETSVNAAQGVFLSAVLLGNRTVYSAFITHFRRQTHNNKTNKVIATPCSS